MILNSASGYGLLARTLHWAMAAMIVSMIFIGVAMTTLSTETRTALLEIHRSMGLVILALALVRLVMRVLDPPPPNEALAGLQRFAAEAVHWVFYALMIAMPLIGWAMLSAGGFPVSVFGGVILPSLLPENASLYATLRLAHAVGAYAFFLAFLTHLAAALFHGLIRRDQIFARMQPW